MKEQMCEIGRRSTQGVRCGQRRQHHLRLTRRNLCTPTMVSKASSSEDICRVDYNRQAARGTKKRTSECCCTCRLQDAARLNAVSLHPPHATAFAVRARADPQVRAARVEVFLGEVAMAVYERPGPEVRDTILPYTKDFATPSSWPTTAPSATARTWRKRTGTRRSWTPTARS